MYIGDYLARRCVYSPDALALIDIGSQPAQRLTYRQLNGRANQLANWLRDKGITKDERVAMLALDGVEFYDAFFACSKLGAIFTPLNWRLHPREIENQIRLTSPKILLHSFEPPIDEIVNHLGAIKNFPEFIDLNILESIYQKTSADPVTCEPLTERDTACLLFTGGTTGQAKAAQISHGQIVWNTFNALLADVLGSDTFLNIFPMFHTGGLFAFSVPILILGGRVIQTKKFDAEQILETIEKEKVTIFGGVPTIFQMLTAAPNWEKANLRSLRYCLSGGAPMPIALIQKFQKEKGVVFRQGFGMTEFGPDVFSLASADAERKMGSIGKPNFFVDARIVDPQTNEPLPANKIGELVLRGPSATTGYFNNPEATRAAFDSENFFHTGDLAYVDEEGYFFIVDRLKDMFISGGENVYPAEVEAVLYQHPAVALCAVIGVPEPKWGEVGKVFVVLEKGKKLTETEVLNFLRQRLAKYKIPQSVVFVESLPKTAIGKVDKKALT